MKTALNWARAIETCIPENVLKMYHPEGALWGTLAQELRFRHQEIFGYFEEFLKKEDLKCEFKDGCVRICNEFAFYSGTYEFTWKFSGHEVLLPARFSFVYKKEAGNWLIMEHHSSMFPEKPFRIEKYFES